MTIDTMYVRDALEARAGKEHVDRLLEAQEAGLVDVAVAAVIEDEIPTDPLASRLSELPALGVGSIPRVAVLGEWVLGRDVLGSQGAVDYFNTTPLELPGDADQKHLHAHIAAGRDIFLTRDGGVIRLSGELEGLGVTVMTLPEFLKMLSATREPGSGARRLMNGK